MKNSKFKEIGYFLFLFAILVLIHLMMNFRVALKVASSHFECGARYLARATVLNSKDRSYPEYYKTEIAEIASEQMVIACRYRPNNERYLFGAAKALEMAKKWVEATQYYQRVIEVGGDNASEAKLAISFVNQEMKNDQIEASYQRAGER